jgi:hypothetical protein
VYIEDVFSTYLYTGNGSTQTITNNIDLSTKGGLTWIKGRTQAFNHTLVDTVRGATNLLVSNTTDAQATQANSLTAFTSTGFSIGAGSIVNYSGDNFASWTFRKQPKFFDVVTYTGTGSNTTIAHTLGAVPGCIIVKRTDTSAAWAVYHRSLANTQYLVLNDTAAAATGATWWNSTTPTSAVFSVGTDASVNASGGTYVAYIYAHDAGGFGLAGTDNVISCGSYTGNNSAIGPEVTLGYEPQWVMVKQSSAAGQYWNMIDVMRGFNVSTGAQTLGANAADIEYTNAAFGSGTPIMSPTATGFQVRSAQPATNASGETYIYIAIRRGPMKVPTVGTSVFDPVTYTGAGAGTTYTTNFPVDMTLVKSRTTVTQTEAWDRLRGGSQYLLTDSTNAEANFGSQQWLADRMTSIKWNGGDGYSNTLATNYVTWNFKRAPGFFDEVCYTAVSPAGANVITHNLGVAPELVIAKTRSASARNWAVVCSYTGFGSSNGYRLNSASAQGNDGPSAVSTTTVTMDMPSDITQAGETQVAYLFATCAGVSKVGTYTGNGSSQTIACGFSAGSRFVLIKRTDSTGDWYVWDSARGIVAGNDPHLSLNTTAAEVTTDDSVDTDNSGFIVNQVAATNVNVTSATYIFLAIA